MVLEGDSFSNFEYALRKVNEQEAEEMRYNGSTMAELNDPAFHGWSFAAGTPEHLFFADRLMKPGNRVLDVGSGPVARASLPFALRNIAVTAVDNPVVLAELEQFKNAPVGVPLLDGTRRVTPLPIECKPLDIYKDSLGDEEFDVVLLDQVISHAPSRKDGYDVIQKCLEALKPEGHLWVRATSIEDPFYRRLAYSYSMHGGGVYWKDSYTAQFAGGGHGHGSGMDYVTFYEPAEIPLYLSMQGVNFVHTQVMPGRSIPFSETDKQQYPHLKPYAWRDLPDDQYRTSEAKFDADMLRQVQRNKYGRPNIMYGENFEKAAGMDGAFSFISVLVQKEERRHNLPEVVT